MDGFLLKKNIKKFKIKIFFRVVIKNENFINSKKSFIFLLFPEFKYFILIIQIGLVICLTITNPVKSGGGSGWQAISPNEWNNVFPACRGNNQSPINIITNNTVYDDQLEDFVLHNYYKEFQWNVSFDTFSSKI